MESAEAPKGPGWVKLSERTYMNNLEALKKNKTVFKGKHLIDGEWCDIAVKVTVSYDDKSLNEVKLQLKVEDHPNIIRLYDADLIDGGLFRHVYIAMELCSQNLQDFIEERKSIPLDFKLYFLFAEQIVSALAHIHQHNILHRDLKLENILLSSTKDNIRVADFGLSKQLLDGHSVATTSYRGLGTDGYRAPELLHEKPMASYRSDSFSLGIVLAMLFSNGHHPFGPDPSRWRTNITDNKSQDLSHILAFNEPYHHKRELLLDLIKQCLQPDPKARPTPEKILQHGFFYGLMEESTTKTGIVCEVTEDFQIPFSTRGFFEKSGPGWIKLSEKTYMNNLQPIKDRILVFKGKQFLAGEWRPIAVKLIMYDEKSHIEVQLHLKLKNHPNIVRMYDTGVTKQPFPYIYIAMELCSQTLKDFIEERKDIPLDFQRYFDFAKQIVSAVAFIHKSNILHRDLKLENILVSPSKDCVRVADLGLSKQILEGHSIATASFRGLGSDGYRAPELLHEKPTASFRSDSFSLGIILAMLFSNGRHPYGSDPARWRTNIADNKAKSLTHIVSFKEPYSHKRVLLVDLIEKCLEHDRNGRPTPNEMLQHRFFTTDLQEGHASATGVENPFMPEENFNEKESGCLSDDGGSYNDGESYTYPHRVESDAVPHGETPAAKPVYPAIGSLSDDVEPQDGGESSDRLHCGEKSDDRNKHLVLLPPAHFERLEPIAWMSRGNTTGSDARNEHLILQTPAHFERLNSVAWTSRDYTTEGGFWNDDGRSHTDAESYNDPRRVESDALPQRETPAAKPVDPESEFSNDDGRSHTDGESYNYPRRVESDAVPHGETPATKPVDPESESSSDGDDGPHDVGESNDRSRGGERSEDRGEHQTSQAPTDSERPEHDAGTSHSHEGPHGKTLEHIHSVSDICRIDHYYAIKNQLFYDGELLRIFCVFWIEDGLRIPKTHHAESSILEVTAKHDDTIHFKFEDLEKNVSDLRNLVDFEEKFRLSYFSHSKCITFQRCVRSIPDESDRYIHFVYHMCAVSRQQQKLQERMKNLGNIHNHRKTCKNCIHGKSSPLFDYSIKIFQGDDGKPSIHAKNLNAGGNQTTSHNDSTDAMHVKHAE